MNKYDNRLGIVLSLLAALIMYAIGEGAGVIIFAVIAVVMAVMHGKRKIKFKD